MIINFAIFHIFIFLILQNVDQGASFRDVRLRQLPAKIRDDIINILTSTLDYIHPCQSNDTEEIKFLLYTQKNLLKPIDLNSVQDIEIEGNKPTVLVIHGWLSNTNSSGFPKIRDAYLTKHDYNVIMIDWSTTANTIYTHAYCALPIIAKEVAKFLCLLDSKHNIPLEMVHLVGHSLGGQMTGLIGQYTKILCEKQVERITAMDPAGPLYLGIPPNSRLDSSDARFVQVIHTNGGVFGYLTGCGHTDFYVNCGLHQRGCITIDLTNIKKLLDTLLSDITCSHSRSQDYMAESIYKDNFVGQSCVTCPIGCMADVISRKSVNMGEYSPKDSKGSYMLTTGSKSPFGKLCNSITYGICI